MATQPSETRSARVVVLMTPSEKRALSERARDAGLSTGEYMRLAAEFGTITPAEEAELLALTEELAAANARLHMTFAKLEETARRADAIDEDALRARYRAEFEARNDIDWAGLAEMLTGPVRP